MPAALLDTNAISDLMRDHPKVKARIGKHAVPIMSSAIVVGEIRYGLDRMPAGKKRTDLEARAKSILGAIRTEPVTPQIADFYGFLKASLESQGLSLGDNDLWIAATAMVHVNLLVTRDKGFGQVSGLQVEDWSV